jgi:hypothetical protein
MHINTNQVLALFRHHGIIKTGIKTITFIINTKTFFWRRQSDQGTRQHQFAPVGGANHDNKTDKNNELSSQAKIILSYLCTVDCGNDNSSTIQMI